MDTLYHYCSNDSFAAIVRTRSVWLSSLSLSNDTMEGRLVNSTLMRLAESDDLDADSRDKLKASVDFIERMFDGLGFCLSEDGDLLSQWRGYADDARGVSVGFSRKYLEQLADSSKGKSTAGFALYKVAYKPNVHDSKVEPTYRELRHLIDAGAFKLPRTRSLLDTRSEDEIAKEDERVRRVHSALFRKLLELFPHLFEMKTSAFKEEREWRLVSILLRNITDQCLYRAARDRIVPYRAFDLSPSDIPAIGKVVLGPRNETPTIVVESMLNQTGFGEVEVRRSDATYR